MSYGEAVEALTTIVESLFLSSLSQGVWGRFSRNSFSCPLGLTYGPGPLEPSHFPADLLALEQDAVFGLESLLVLCSQDEGPGAQATLKVSTSSLCKGLGPSTRGQYQAPNSVCLLPEAL